jgi:hypothetical protein
VLGLLFFKWIFWDSMVRLAILLPKFRSSSESPDYQKACRANGHADGYSSA